MEDCHTLTGRYKLCIQLSKAKLVEIEAGIELSRPKDVSEVIVEIEIGKHVALFSLCQVVDTIPLPHLNLEDS